MAAKRSFWAVIIAVAVAAGIAVGWRWQNDPEHGWKQVLNGDTRGYHAYLTALFVDHDLGRQDTNSVFVHHTPDGTLLKYYPGTALCMAPAFLTAHGLALLGADVPDGRSAVYAKAISIGALLFFFLGLWALRRLLLELGVPDALAAVLLLATGVGTNLLRFAAIVPGMPHVYAFTTIAAFLLFALRFARSQRAADAWCAGALLGSIVLIRPVDAIVVLALPLVLGDALFPALRALFTRARRWMPAFVFVLLPMLVMPLLWYAQTGHWWQWSYRREGFYWTHPRMWDALFSFRQGLLIYTPVFWTTVGGTVLLFRSDRVRAFAALGYLLIMTYVISAWWSWTYGDGLGIRAFIDHYAVLAVIAALGLMRAGARVQRASIAFASLAGLLACAQLYQYEHGIFHRFAMDREKYVFTFLRFDPALRNALGGDVETAPFHPNGMSLVAEGICTMETPDPYWQGGKVEERARVAISGRHVCVLDSTAEHGPVFAVQGSQLVPDRGAHVVVDMKRYEAKAGDSSRALYAISLGAPEEPSRYFSSGLLNPVPGRTDSTWRSIHLELQVPFDVRTNEELRFFVWNIDHQSFLLDDIAVKVYRVNSY